MRTPPISVWLAALLLAAIPAACTQSPASPASVPVANLSVTRLEAAGPQSVPPGETAQFKATAHYSNGSSADVTNEGSWQSSNMSVLSISGTGLATAHERGEAAITVKFSTAWGIREVIVVPAGSYRLTGTVTEAEAGSAVVSDARVEVTSGPAAGLWTTTGQDGRYRLYGLSGDSQVRVTREGFEPHLQSIPVTDHQTHNFQLRLLNLRPDVSGTYRLTITAAGDCSDALPEPARSRAYTAVVTQSGPQLDVRLAGASFVVNAFGRGDRFRGRVDPGGLTFSLTPYRPAYYYGYEQYPDVFERLGPGTFLAVEGSVVAAISSTHLPGALSGSFQIFDSALTWGPLPVLVCRAAAHQFVLSRE